ncbi:MAG TPA: hypothetical protein VMA72_05720 [Streptosporangiaceae bacterium]|nr:hypothetical protein [Streptosporangiaceae bacterium]
MALAAFAALLLTLNVVSGFYPKSSPDYETPGVVAGNVATGECCKLRQVL